MIYNKTENNILISKDNLQIINDYIQSLSYEDYILHPISPTSRLDKISQKFYNDSSLWWAIALLNNIDSYSLYIGDDYKYDKILIPNNIKTLISKITK